MELRQLMLLAHSVVSDSNYSSDSMSDRIIRILDKLSECPIRKLILYNSTIALEQMSCLCQCISTPSFHLTSIVLGNTRIGNKGANLLAIALVTGGCSVEQLVLDSCCIGNPGACALAEALCTNKSVWKLDLHGNCISDAACFQLSRILIESMTLQVLGLSNNNIGDQGILCYLAPALCNTSGVSQLELVQLTGNPRLTDSSYKSLGEAWTTFQTMSLGKRTQLRIELDLGSIGELQ